MYAVIETGGKQYRVTEGEVVFLERLGGDPGEDVTFDKIMACSNEVETDFGKPYLDGVSVVAKILGHGKDKKIVIFKYKAKKGYRKKQGHRQPYTKVRIERIISDRLGVAEYVAEVESENGDDTDEVVNVNAVAADAENLAADKAEGDITGDNAADDVAVESGDADTEDSEKIDR